MSKKKPNRPQPKKESESTKTSRPVQKAPVQNTGFELIRFDLKTWIFISFCIASFLVMVALKLHNSSIPRWNQVVNDGGDPNRGLLSGTPLRIRSDEWLVGSSFLISQASQDFPVANEAIGYGKAAFAMGLPTNHLVSAMRPVLWGYYLLDIERAFSWHWNFKIFPFLISSFLLLMLFTRNNFLLSLFGSVWLLLSSAIQWWSINTEIFTYGFVSVIAFTYILYSDKPKTILLNGALLILAAFSYAMYLYPAYQVPYAYFLLALIVGFALQHRKIFIERIAKKLPWKLATTGITLMALGGLLYLFYVESKDTIDVITQTVYPGQRDEKGGDFTFIKLFTDNFSLFMNQDKFPANWGNICELSSFLMLSPIAAVLILIDFIKTRKTSPVLLSIFVFQVIMYAWLFLGLPDAIAKYSFLKTSPTYRTFFVFGFTNCVATLLFLSYHRSEILKNRLVAKAISLVAILIVSYVITSQLNKQGLSFFTSGQVMLATLFFAGLNWLVVHFQESKTFQYGFYGLALLFVIPNSKINPYSQGLSPYFENKVFKAVAKVQATDPDARWIVFGNFTWANYIKAAGVKCFNGVQFAPQLEKLHVLDPAMKNDSIYNRYAHINFASMIDGRDSIKFSLNQNDMYSVQMDPCSPKLTELDITYILFTYEPQAIEIQCMTLVPNDMHLFIYKRNEQ